MMAKLCARLFKFCSFVLVIVIVLKLPSSALGSGCIAPVPASQFELGEEDLTAAVNSMRCELGCIKQNGPGVSLPQLDSETAWPTLEFDALNENCNLYQKVHECKAGCMRHFGDPNLLINRCRDNCYTQCTSELCTSEEESCMQQTNLICPRECRKTFCRFGCALYNTLTTSTDSNSLPPSPSTTPHVQNLAAESNEKWLYTINTRVSLPNISSTSSNQTQNTVGYLLKISSSAKSLTRYVWQRNLSTPMDLSPFACSEVSISFAVASQYSTPTLLQFSPEAVISVAGMGGRPSQVSKNSINVHYSEDFRNGFLGYSVANITWNRPNGYQFLSSYTIRVYPDSDDCGGNGITHTYTEINKDADYFVIQARTPNGLMKFGCSYIFEILAHPTTVLIGSYITSVSQLSEPLPVMDVHCDRVWDASGYFNVSLTWSFPDSAQLSHVRRFVVTPILPNSFASRSTYSLENTEEWHNSFNMTLSRFLPRVNSSDNLAVEVRAEKNTTYTWRDLPRPQSCIVKLNPIPPKPPQDILIENIDFNTANKQLRLNVQWSPPVEAHGRLTKCELFIGETSHTDSDGVPDGGYIQTFEENVTEAEINRTFHVNEGVHCLQLQMRAFNNYSLSSNWSDPLVLPLDSECRTGSSVSSDNSSTSESSKENIAVYLEREAVGSVKLLELGCDSDSALFGAPDEDSLSTQLLSLGQRVDNILSQVTSDQDRVESLQEKLNSIEHKLDVLMELVAQHANQGT